MHKDNTIQLNSAHLSATILRRGATLSDLRFQGAEDSLILGFADPENHSHIPVYAGAIVGPIANRIRAGRVTIGDKRHQMPLNENGATCLHSGPDGMHARDWTVLDQSENSVTLTVTLRNGDQGLPGHREISARYALNDTTLTLEITAKTDSTTPMNIAHHPYWNLNGCGHVGGHTLHIHAETYLPTDAQNLPTGEIMPMRDTLFDFAAPRPVPLSPDLDVNFCLSEQMRTTPRPCATLTTADGTNLEIATNAPGLQVYSGAFLPDKPGVLHGGHDLHTFGGIALEPQFWPDAAYHRSFPNILLPPRDIWRQTTRYRLTQST